MSSFANFYTVPRCFQILHIISSNIFFFSVHTKTNILTELLQCIHILGNISHSVQTFIYACPDIVRSVKTLLKQ